MSDDWQIGDLAVCVTPVGGCCHRDTVRVGDVYRVGGLDSEFGLWLLLPDVPPTNCRFCVDEPLYEAAAFRKILPDKHEDCEPEFVTLLNRIKRKVSA